MTTITTNTGRGRSPIKTGDADATSNVRAIASAEARMKEKKKKQKERKKENDNNNNNNNTYIRKESENCPSNSYSRSRPSSFLILTKCELQMELKDDHDNKLQQNLNKKAVYCKYGEVLSIWIYVVYLLSILLSVCVTSVPGPKVDLHPYTLQIISSTNSNTCFVNDRGISNIDFGDTAVDQGLAPWTQHGVFVFGENYHSKVLVNDGNLILTNYHSLVDLGYDNL